jgi:hypothetical protein
MKEHVEKNKKKYTFGVFIVFAVIIVILILAGLKVFTGPQKTKGSISISFDDKSIETGKSTYLTLGAKNNGKTPLNGEFKFVIDNPDEVKINYPSPELLKFQLLAGESIERRLNVTGTSKAYKTYYRIVISIEGQNTTYAKDEAFLIVSNTKNK